MCIYITHTELWHIWRVIIAELITLCKWWHSWKLLGAVSIRKTVLLGMVIPMLKIRRPTGRLIFNMGIPIPGKTVFYIETGPWTLTHLFFSYQTNVKHYTLLYKIGCKLSDILQNIPETSGIWYFAQTSVYIDEAPGVLYAILFHFTLLMHRSWGGVEKRRVALPSEMNFMKACSILPRSWK